MKKCLGDSKEELKGLKGGTVVLGELENEQDR